MARPKAKELTARELEIMHVFWERSDSDTPKELTVAEVRDDLEQAGRELAYTTVATLVRILVEKSFLKQTNEERPFLYCSIRSFEDVSGSMLGDMIQKVFGGSREKLLLRLLEERQLSPQELKKIKEILKEES
ncbi:BlaI/MecI/CopY family transcriptional regulator [Gimesia maris]|uniref:BlaI/MecI/CopY family transcriptional regulator n=1 Tax=Gimesia maris TaxID=122 RepID=UPI000E82147D|nr:BlaI/MecI/CopY family transcriptional regulator [Gimesia maris]HAW28610.1 CopY family transcriptional regulator [Planctomycetaceae bacterium]|tara:strand:- start:108 stop:506 length:399 start_codon:yes stop_codon:yes gene_type:complete